jgi:hypothetical protein
VTLSSCGRATINQLKIVSSLEEAIPGLHIVTNIKYTECKTCLNRLKKNQRELEEFRTVNEIKVRDYLDNIKPKGVDGIL